MATCMAYHGSQSIDGNFGPSILYVFAKPADIKFL